MARGLCIWSGALVGWRRGHWLCRGWLLTSGQVGGLVPRIVLGVERLAGLPHRQRQVQQLAHGVADGDARLVGVLGADALIKRPDGGVVLRGAEGGHPEIAADQVVAAPGHDHA